MVVGGGRCPAGTFANQKGNKAAGDCSPCSPGAYCDKVSACCCTLFISCSLDLNLSLTVGCSKDSLLWLGLAKPAFTAQVEQHQVYSPSFHRLEDPVLLGARVLKAPGHR